MPRWNNTARVIAAPGFIEPCVPTPARKPPTGPLWLHEIKHDGYRLLVRKSAGKVRIYTRRGADWTHRFPAIVTAASKIRAASFYIDGEGVVTRDDAVAVFERLHNKSSDDLVFLYAFDVIELVGVDLRKVPLLERKRRLRRLLGRRRSGIVFNEHIEGDGKTIFTHACDLGCEGIVSKRRDLSYRSGRAKCWIKTVNPKAPARLRIEEGTF
jgi:ATP-dependent DNA ligase